MVWIDRPGDDWQRNFEDVLQTASVNRRSSTDSDSLKDWCQALGIVFFDKQRATLVAELVEGMRKLQSSLHCPSDTQGALVWKDQQGDDWEQNLQAVLRTASVDRRSSKNGASLQNLCQALGIDFKGKKRVTLVS